MDCEDTTGTLQEQSPLLQQLACTTLTAESSLGDAWSPVLGSFYFIFRVQISTFNRQIFRDAFQRSYCSGVDKLGPQLP